MSKELTAWTNSDCWKADTENNSDTEIQGMTARFCKRDFRLQLSGMLLSQIGTVLIIWPSVCSWQIFMMFCWNLTYDLNI